MPLTTEQRQRIVKEATAWIDTPYRPNTCIRQVGCDCGQFLFGCFSNLGFIPKDFDIPKNYSIQSALHQNDPSYIDTARRVAREIPESEVQPGDFVIYKFGKAFSHGAIIVEWPHFIIHSLKRDGVTGGDGMNLRFAKREKVFLTLKDEFCLEKK
jgi:cell wall-associated NlpC family hydrolase